MTISEIEHLRMENEQLRGIIAALQSENSFLKQHETIRTGIKGERLIADLTSGKLTKPNSSFDIQVAGLSVEVKYSKLNEVSYTQKGVLKLSSSKRWTWTNVFGVGGKKQYDFIILVGDVDERYRQHTKASDGSPYVFFALSKEDVAAFVTTKKGNIIQLTTNPEIFQDPIKKTLYYDHQYSLDEVMGLAFLQKRTS